MSETLQIILDILVLNTPERPCRIASGREVGCVWNLAAPLSVETAQKFIEANWPVGESARIIQQII